MSRIELTVFLCDGKDCRKAWRRLYDGSRAKWLKRQVEAAGLPYKVHVVRTECMDKCADAANLCVVHDRRARCESRITSEFDAQRLLAALRDVAESSPCT